MRIAFVSYEYAGIAAGGGIGTYVRGAAAMLAARGHQVEVFTNAAAGTVESSSNVLVHHVMADRPQFAAAVLPNFSARHAAAPFDVVEGPEFGADAAAIAAAFPDLPLVVKLHTPTFLISEINHAYVPPWRAARYLIGGLRRGRAPKPYWVYDPGVDPECAHALAASEITAPSRTIMDLLGARWALPAERLSHVPYPFIPAATLLDASLDTLTRRVTFVGRLEVRKGVIELAKAISLVLAQAPDTRFRLIGRSGPHPATGEDMQSCMRRLIGPFASLVEFVGAVPYSQIPGYLSDTDICVFPSVWEASGFVCKEAMAAGRGVVASGGSGMAEIIEDGRTGRLAPPRNSGALARALLEMLSDPARRMEMGRAAREHVSDAFSPNVIAPLQEASYRRALERKRLPAC
jgi:glycosyltransferase involved in cell wall biosynthesis